MRVESSDSGHLSLAAPTSATMDSHNQPNVQATGGTEPFPLLQLPEDIILYILSTLPGADVCAVAATCTMLNALASEPALWCTMLSQRFGEV